MFQLSKALYGPTLMGDYEISGEACDSTVGETHPPPPSPGVNWLDSGGVAGLFSPTEDQQQHKTKYVTSFCCKVVHLNLNICAFSPCTWQIFLLCDLFLPQVLRRLQGTKGEASWFQHLKHPKHPWTSGALAQSIRYAVKQNLGGRVDRTRLSP